MEVNATPDALLARLNSIDARLNSIDARQRGQDELIDELRPIVSVAMRVATQRLDAFERKGHFESLRELAKVGERVLEGYSADDVRQFGDAVLGILDTVRAMTQPEVLAVMGDAAVALSAPEKAEALGLVGMVRSTRDVDVQRGLGLIVGLLKKVGQGAAAAQKSRGAHCRPAARLPARATHGGLAATAPRRRPPEAIAPATAPEGADAGGAVMIDGLAFSADGSLVDPSQWTRELGARVAATLGVALTDAHWEVVDFARSDWVVTGSSPNIRRITTSTGVSTKELYALFPRAPARTVAKIAGIPKPAGCL